ncbi:hypothetical protein V8E54_014281 [Elaphomyces granulatus]
MKLAAQSVISLSLFVAAVRSQVATTTAPTVPLFTYCRCVNSELHWANSATENLCVNYFDGPGQTEYDSIGTSTCKPPYVWTDMVQVVQYGAGDLYCRMGSVALRNTLIFPKKQQYIQQNEEV